MSQALAPAQLPEIERLRSLAAAFDDVRQRAEARMGAEDVRRVKQLRAASRSFEGVGRVLIHLSFEPVAWTAGVVALWLHKQLEATEIGHPVLHGCYDKLDGAGSFRSESFYWHIPIDEEAWREGHNLRHHGHTNVAGRDPDMRFGPVRLTDKTRHRWFHVFQLPYTLLMMWPSFGASMNAHFTGVLDILRGETEVLPDLSPASRRQARFRAMRKFAPYYGKEFVFFPALAGPLWWKVALGNAAAELMRDVYSAASIFCGHVGPDVTSFEEGTRPQGKGGWYERQILATHNFEVPYVLSVLCGGLDYQIEHHLFPRLPPERLREVAPEVRAICAEHGVPYLTGSWPRVLGRALGHVLRLSLPTTRDRAAA